MLVVTLTGMLNSFDGGMMGAAQRYFSIYAGTDDRRSTTQLLVTFCVLLTGVGLVISIAAWFLSPVVVGFLNMSAIWRPQAIFLFRTLGILVTTLFIHTLFQMVLNARQRWAWSTAAGFATYVAYVVGFVIVIETGRAFVAWPSSLLANRCWLRLLIIPVAVRYLDRRGISLVPRSKLRSIMSFSGKLQVNGVAGTGHKRSRLVSDRGRAFGSRARHLLAWRQLRQPALFRRYKCSRARRGAPGQRLRACWRGRHVPGVQAAPADVGRGRHRLDHGGDGRRRISASWRGSGPGSAWLAGSASCSLPGARCPS